MVYKLSSTNLEKKKKNFNAEPFLTSRKKSSCRAEELIDWCVD